MRTRPGWRRARAAAERCHAGAGRVATSSWSSPSWRACSRGVRPLFREARRASGCTGSRSRSSSMRIPEAAASRERSRARPSETSIMAGAVELAAELHPGHDREVPAKPAPPHRTAQDDHLTRRGPIPPDAGTAPGDVSQPAHDHGEGAVGAGQVPRHQLRPVAACHLGRSLDEPPQVALARLARSRHRKGQGMGPGRRRRQVREHPGHRLSPHPARRRSGLEVHPLQGLVGAQGGPPGNRPQAGGVVHG